MEQEKIEKRDLIVWSWVDGKIVSLKEMEVRAWRVPGVVERILNKLIRLGFVVKIGSGYRGVIPGESKKYN